MIAADTRTLLAFLKGENGPDIDLVREAMRSGSLVLPPMVLTEILSDPLAAQSVGPILVQLETLEISEGYWQRAGEMRRKLKSRGVRCNMADALIAQSCIDRQVPLATRDTVFRRFADECGLLLA